MGRHGTIAGRKEAQDKKRAASFTKLVRLIKKLKMKILIISSKLKIIGNILRLKMVRAYLSCKIELLKK